MNLPYANIGGLYLPYSVSLLVDILSSFLIISLLGSAIYLIFHLSFLYYRSNKQYLSRQRGGFRNGSAVGKLSDDYAMLVKLRLLIVICVLELLTFLTVLGERLTIMVFADVRGIASDNSTCTLDQITPYLYHKFPLTGFLVSMAVFSIISMFFFLIILLKYLANYYENQELYVIRFQHRNSIIIFYAFISLFVPFLVYKYTFFVAFSLLLIITVIQFITILMLLRKIYKIMKRRIAPMKDNLRKETIQLYRKHLKMIQHFRILAFVMFSVVGLFLYSHLAGHFSILFKLILYDFCFNSFPLSSQLSNSLMIFDKAIEYSVLISFHIAALALVIPYIFLILFKLGRVLKVRISALIKKYKSKFISSDEDLNSKLID